MDLYSLSPYVRKAMHSELHPYTHVGQRTIFDYELIYLAAGKMGISLGGKEYIAVKGDYILLRPGQPHTLYGVGAHITQPHIHFDLIYDAYSPLRYISFKDLPEFTEEEQLWIHDDLFTDLPEDPILRISDPVAFTALFYEILTLYNHPPEFYPILCKQKMLALLGMLLRDNTVYEPVRTDLPLAATIRHFIDYNFLSTITLDSLEKQFNYSRFHINRLFSEYTGTTVIRYYDQKRMDYAKSMLLSGAAVTDVAERLQFRSIYTFSRHFKTAVGCSPSRYKAKGENALKP